MTKTTVSIQVPVMDDDTDLADFFAGQLRNEFGELRGNFLQAIDTDVSVHNDRAVLDDALIEEVEIDADGNVLVEYQLEFSWYYGCSNMDGSDEACGSVRGMRAGDKWIFEIPKPQERRSTLDEF